MEEASRTNKRLIIAVGVVAVVAFAAIGLRAFVASAFGGPLDALQALPRDIDAVMVIDLADARDLANSELLEYAVRAAQESGELPAGEPGEALIEQLESELGLSFEDDILSFIGRSFAVGVGGDLTEPEPTTIVAAMTIRNQNEAWNFVELVIDKTVESDPRVIVTETTSGDRRTIVIESVDEQAHVTVHGDHLIMANSRRSLDSSLNALENGSSVLDTRWLEAANSKLPESSIFKAMVDPSFVNSGLNEVRDSGLDPGVIPDADFVAMGMGMGLDGNQMSFDFFVERAEPIDIEGFGPLPLAQLAALANTPDVVLGMAMPDEFGRTVLDEMERSEPGLVGDMSEALQQEFGIDPTGAIEQIGGHMWFAAAAGDFETLGTFGLAIGLADPAPVLRFLDDLARTLEAQGVQVLSQNGRLDFPELDVSVVVDDELRVTMDQSGSDGEPFATSAGYQWLTDNFGDAAVLYMDVYALMASEQAGIDPETLADLDAFRIGASFEVEDRSVIGSAIVEIDLNAAAFD